MAKRTAKNIVAATLFAALCASAWAAPAPQAEGEIGHLLDYVTKPGCKFNRNGTWYDGAEARKHLQQKYDYLIKRGMVSNAESFIERAATESSMSGKAYLVQCGNAAPVPSATYLGDELKRFRAHSASPAK